MNGPRPSHANDADRAMDSMAAGVAVDAGVAAQDARGVTGADSPSGSAESPWTTAGRVVPDDVSGRGAATFEASGSEPFVDGAVVRVMACAVEGEMDAGLVVAADSSPMSGWATALGDERAAAPSTAMGAKEAPCREIRVPIDFDQPPIVRGAPEGVPSHIKRASN